MKANVKDNVDSVLLACLDCNHNELEPQKCLFTDLYVDSLTLVDIIIGLSDMFDIEFTDADLDKINNVESIYFLINEKLNSRKL